MRIVFVLLAVIAFASELHAQGTVVFHNLKPTAVISNALTGARIQSGTAFKAALYFATDSGAAPPDSAFAQIGAAADFGVAPGHFDGGQRIIPGADCRPDALPTGW